MSNLTPTAWLEQTHAYEETMWVIHSLSYTYQSMFLPIPNQID